MPWLGYCNQLLKQVFMLDFSTALNLFWKFGFWSWWYKTNKSSNVYCLEKIYNIVYNVVRNLYFVVSTFVYFCSFQLNCEEKHLFFCEVGYFFAFQVSVMG